MNDTLFTRQRRATRRGLRITFAEANRRIQDLAPDILESWLPENRVDGDVFVCLNPRRVDNNLGSFRLTFHGPRAGLWCDFALPKAAGARGGDFVAFYAYCRGIGQGAALKELAHLLPVAEHGGTVRPIKPQGAP